MRIVKKTLKGDLMGQTGFKTVPSRRKSPSAIPDSPGGEARPADAAQRVLENVRDDDITVITEPVPVRHGKAIILNNADHQEVPPEGTRVPGAPSAQVPGAPPSGSGATQGRAGHAASTAAPVPSGPAEPAGAPQLKRKAKASPNGVAASPSQQASLASSARAGASPPQASHAPGAAHVLPASAPKPLILDGGSATLARSVLAEALFRDVGAPGTKVSEPRGSHFLVHPRHGAGVVRTLHNLVLPLPEGHATNHAADLVVELENGALLVLDMVPSSVTANDLKALSFDALQLRRLDLAFSVLVYIRGPSGIPQDQAQAIAHGYDFHFGVPEDQLHSEQAFTALRARITQWLKAASAK